MTACGTTHHEGCPCHEARHNAEIERLREQVAINEERYEAWRRRWDEMREIAAENKAEVDRLRDGIRQVDEWERRSVGEVNDFTGLRRIIDPLLEENHDDR